MFKISGSFSFGNMPFFYEYENDDSMDVAEIFIQGNSVQAKNALECDNFNNAIYEYIRKKMVVLND